MFRIHHLPQGELSSTDFQVEINGQETAPWYCRVSAMPYNTVWPGCQRPVEQTETASFISFEMEEPVRISLTAWKDFSEAVVRPLSRGITPLVHGRRIEFTISAPGAYTVELDGPHRPLHIFADPLTDFGVDKTAENVLYFGPGVHEVGDLELEDGQTLFVDGGAVLYGSVSAIHKKNVSVVGYGIIDGSREIRTSASLLIPVSNTLDLREEKTLRDFMDREKILKGCVHFFSCQDVRVCGVMARDSSTFAFIVADCERADISYIKTIGMWRYNSDGIDLFNSRYVRLENAFLRDFDDCIVLKGIKGWDTQDLHHVSVTGCVVWCDWGSALEIGAETCADQYHDVLFENCDVIHGSHVMMRIHNSDRAHVHDVVYRDVRCEYRADDEKPVYQDDMTRPYREVKTQGYADLIDCPVYDGPYSEDHILGKTSHILFDTIRIFGPDSMRPVCEFGAQDEEHGCHDITLQGVTLNGRTLTEEDLQITSSPFNDPITVRP